MRTIIAGSRDIEDYDLVDQACKECGRDITTVLSGGARGVDRLGEEWAAQHMVPVEIYPAHWEEHGKAAGAIRNRHMASVAEALVAVWDGKSPGTRQMIACARAYGLKVYIKNTSEEQLKLPI